MVRKVFALLIAVFLLLPHFAGPFILAQEDPSPEGLHHEHGGVSSKNIDLSKGKDVWEPKPVRFNWNGPMGPPKLNVPNGDAYFGVGKWLTRSRVPLTPLMIQKETDDPATYLDQYYSAKAELCTFNLEGEKVAKEINEDILKSEPVKHLNYMRRELGTIGPELVPGEKRADFTFNEDTVLEGIPHNCSSDDKGIDVQSQTANVIEKGFYAVLSFLFGIPGKIAALLSGDPKDTEHVEAKAHAAVTTKFPRSKYLCYGVHCQDGDVTDEADVPKAGIADMVKEGGLDYRPEFVHGEIEQKDFEIGNDTQDVKLNYSVFGLFETGMKFLKCSIMPESMQVKAQWNNCQPQPTPTITPGVCDPSWFTDKLTMNKGSKTGGATGDPGYTIAYRNPSCKLTQPMIDAAKNLASTGYNGGSQASANIDKYIQDVENYSNQYKWNPLFVLALWIEESGAGGNPNAGWHTGCLYGWKDGNAVSMPKIKEGGTVCDQMACTFSHPSADPADFARFMCSYNSTAISNGKCPDAPNWAFASNLKLVYETLLEKSNTPVTGGACGFSNLK